MSEPGFGIYLHWPYCASICPYCDFNVRRDRGGDHRDLLEAIGQDLRGQAARVSRRGAGSLFLGGGTPSLLNGADVAALIAAADAAFGLEADAEITLEANPEHHGGFGDLVAAGVNRLSLGVQSLRTPALMQLGRRHSAREAQAAIEAALNTGARVSIDLIYGRDGQSTEEWAGELGEALALGVEHLSLYQLTIEDGTPFARAVARGRMAALDSAAAADFYELTQTLCEDAGMGGYEISNHARDAAAQARHNLVYWRGGDWIGAGPGAHGRVDIDGARTATRAHAAPQAYTDAVKTEGVGWAETERLSDAAIADEMLLMGLRLTEGVARAPIEARRGAAFARSRLDALAADNLLHTDDVRLRLTAKGRPLADRIVLELS